MDVWDACQDSAKHRFLSGRLIRVVESQEQIATNHLVETLDEQHLLEQLLERNKPRLNPTEEELHYLLATPFRYPPLKYGSRFGKKSEPSLFYGSLQLSTALAETAYYRFVFWLGMRTPPAAKKFVTQHTAFGACYRTVKGLPLHKPPFNAFHSHLSDPASYSATQPLGSALRAQGTEVIEFASARDKGLNVALFTPRALAEKTPTFQQQWLCETQANEVAFYSATDQAFHHFEQEQFKVNGLFPVPSV